MDNLIIILSVISSWLGFPCIPLFLFGIIFKEYIRKKRFYIIIAVSFIFFLISFFIMSFYCFLYFLGSTITICIIFAVLTGFIVCSKSKNKKLINKFNKLLAVYLVILFFTCPVLLVEISNKKFKYYYKTRVEIQKIAAKICVFPSIKRDIYKSLYLKYQTIDNFEAMKMCELAYKYDKSRYSKIHSDLFNIYIQNKQFTKAEKLAQNNIPMLIDLLLAKGKNNEALEIANKYYAGIEDRYYHYYFAQIYIAMKEYENALNHIRKALDIQKDGSIFMMESESFYALRSIIYFKTGDKENALKEYKKIGSDKYNYLFERYNIELNI